MRGFSPPPTLASATAPFDANEVLARALASFPQNGRNQYGGAILSVAIVGGPAQAVLRPSRMEDPQLAERLEQEALFGAARIFARGESSKSGSSTISFFCSKVTGATALCASMGKVEF
jgi:hypothetical protein